MSDRMHKFKDFIDAVDTPGGHIVIAVVLGMLGVAINIWVVMMAWPDEKMALLLMGAAEGLTAFLGIAAYAMRGSARANGKNNENPPPESK